MSDPVILDTTPQRPVQEVFTEVYKINLEGDNSYTWTDDDASKCEVYKIKVGSDLVISKFLDTWILLEDSWFIWRYDFSMIDSAIAYVARDRTMINTRRIAKTRCVALSFGNRARKTSKCTR